MKLYSDENGFKLVNDGKAILEHSLEKPFIYLGLGQEDVKMYRGNFDISDYVEQRYPLMVSSIEPIDGGYRIDFEGRLVLELLLTKEQALLNFIVTTQKANRFWIRLCATKDERCYGCGEQMSYLNLRGRNFPLWTSEPGVGRDKNSYITWRSDVENQAGGDYYNTNFPQPTFISSSHYYCHVDTTAYADFDFRHDFFHELHSWEIPKQIRIESASSYKELLKKLTLFLGRQRELPSWIYDGLVMGVQGGSERSFKLLDESISQGLKIAAVWCQDWAGKRVTSFGKRLQWDWHYNKEMYPSLPQKIKELKERDIRFLGYVNPYLVNDGLLYQEGKEQGFFAKKADGSDYLVDFGEFYCGVVDLTNPSAYNWFKGIIQRFSIDIGVDGWMADFGEYLPTDDIVLHSGVSAMKEHNHWPVLWAKCNYDAVAERGKTDEIVYFMRAGGAGLAPYCPLLWAGDQSVDFSIHDGLASTICGALSAGMSGVGISHSDIGGYTSLFDNIRSRELFLRWAEMAMFTPVMRSHEGNRPDSNFQYYNDPNDIKALARLVDIYVMLKPYMQQVVKENSLDGLPAQRPLFVHYEDDEATYDLQYQYLLGADLLVAPVYLANQDQWSLYLPKDEWIHLWSGRSYGVGEVTVASPLGYTPVFYRKKSRYSELFRQIKECYGVLE